MSENRGPNGSLLRACQLCWSPEIALLLVSSGLAVAALRVLAITGPVTVIAVPVSPGRRLLLRVMWSPQLKRRESTLLVRNGPFVGRRGKLVRTISSR